MEDICDGNLHLSAKVTLDLNDPYLLVDVRQPHEIQRTRRIGGDVKRRTVNKTLLQRYNISNDEAYDLLKENKQSKVRSTIGQLTIEHSMPALRLQAPYVRISLLPVTGYTVAHRHSTRHGSRLKRRGASIVRNYRSTSIKKLDFQR